MEFIKRFYFRQIAIAVVLGMLFIGAVPARSLAYMVGTEAVASPVRAQDMANVRRILESKLVAGKLIEAGLTPTEIQTRLDKLTDDELHDFSKQLDSVYPGADGLGVIIALLIIVILVMVILKLADKKIIIK